MPIFHGIKKYRYLLVMIFFVLALIVCNVLKSYQDGNKTLYPADIIVCLSGGTGERLTKSACLYKEGLGSKILLTKTKFTDPGVNEFFKRWKHEYLIFSGVGGSDIMQTSGHVTSTYEEGIEVIRWLGANKLKSAIIVSDKNHIKRVKYVFNKLSPGAYNIQYYAVDRSLSGRSNDYLMENKIYQMEEVFKYLVYRLRY